MTGYDRDAVVGRRLVDLLTGGGRIYHETHYTPMLQLQGRVREIALDIRTADGRTLPVLLNAILERDASGAPVVVRIVVFDATERRAYERELLFAKKRAEESEGRARSLARTLQQTLVPPTSPTVPGLDVAGAYRPAGDGDEVGGDFYDIFQVGTDDWVVVLGDVCGKGVNAAVVTALARYTIRGVAVQVQDPAEVLTVLNQVLLDHENGRFLTAVLLRLRRTSAGWEVSMATGGHPAPLLLREGRSTEVVGAGGALVGVLEDPAYVAHRMLLEPGGTLVLYTDGVTEGRRGDDFFGEGRLSASILAHAGSAADVVDGLLADVLVFQDNVARDDIAVVAVRVPPENNLRPGS